MKLIELDADEISLLTDKEKKIHIDLQAKKDRVDFLWTESFKKYLNRDMDFEILGLVMVQCNEVDFGVSEYNARMSERIGYAQEKRNKNEL